MALNSTVPRSDLVFLKRRLRKGEVVKAAEPSKKFSITLSGNVEKKEFKPTQPRLTANMVLDLDNPVVRLNARQSAIGSLIIEGANHFAWNAEGLHGTESITQEDPSIPRYSNRKIVQFYKSSVVIGLMHFKKLRRVVIWGNTKDLVLKTYDGIILTVRSNEGNNALYLSRIGNEIEIRCEAVEDKNFNKTFNI
jgi:hypothetical protein